MGPSSWRAGGEHCFTPIAGLNSAADSDSTPASIGVDSGRTDTSEKPQQVTAPCTTRLFIFRHYGTLPARAVHDGRPPKVSG